MAATAESLALNVNDAPAKKGKEAAWDRTKQDSGNILAIEHINFRIADQLTATAFYVCGLGFTRDPFMFANRIDNMAINIGRNQLHLPTAGGVKNGVTLATPQRMRGTFGVVVPNLADLAERLEKVVPLLKGTQFGYKVHADRVETTCPWGNRVRCHAPSPEFGPTELALAYLEFDVPRGTAAGMARFFREGFRAVASVEKRGGDEVAVVGVGIAQKMLFHETDVVAKDEGYHVAISISDYSGPHRFLKERDLVSDEGQQWRIYKIIDVDTRKVLYELELEVRCIKHALFNRPNLNRDPQDNLRFGPFRGLY
jgi:hypothetical protein